MPTFETEDFLVCSFIDKSIRWEDGDEEEGTKVLVCGCGCCEEVIAWVVEIVVGLVVGGSVVL